MTKKDLSDSDEVIDDTVQDEVTHIFKEHTDDYISKLEGIGFVYHDDESVEEELEEAVAKPENKNQEYLVSFFDDEVALSEKVLKYFLKKEGEQIPTTHYLENFLNKQIKIFCL